MSDKPQQLPPLTCPYANKAGLVIMALAQTGKVQTKTGAALYEVHLPLANGRFKKQGRAMTLNEAGVAAAENEKTLGWDKLPPLVFATARPAATAAPAKKSRAKPIEAAEGEPVIRSIEPAETPAVVVPVESTEPVAKPASPAVSRPEGAKPERAQPKASERPARKKPAEKKPDPIIEAARAASRSRFR